MMMFHQPPTNPVDNDWTGRSVTMHILPGDCNGAYTVHPKLVWKSDGWSRQSGSDARMITVDIFEIHAIMDRMDDPDDDSTEEEDLCFFSITTDNGEVHLFECPNEMERDRIVAGIKNIIARMSFSIIAGDDLVMSELYGGGEQNEGDLPSCKTPTQAMTGIAHSFLDSVAEPQHIHKRATN
jgi:hypothetical protein